MNVLSLFDGISCGQVALQRAGIPVTRYLASEIEKNAIKVTQKNWPNTAQLGDVVTVRKMTQLGLLPQIDLLIGGSPCQGFSNAGLGRGFDDPRSQLFFEYVRIKALLKPRWFLLENVKMKKADMDIISWWLGVEPIFINSADFSAQSRQRYYWTNIPVAPWQDRGIMLKDVLQQLPTCKKGLVVRERIKIPVPNGLPFARFTPFGKLKKGIEKSGCLTSGGHAAGNHSDMDILHSPTFTRRYSITEWERLQTLPDNYTSGIADSPRYTALGNGWTVDVIAHILKGIVQ